MCQSSDQGVLILPEAVSENVTEMDKWVPQAWDKSVEGDFQAEGGNQQRQGGRDSKGPARPWGAGQWEARTRSSFWGLETLKGEMRAAA